VHAIFFICVLLKDLIKKDKKKMEDVINYDDIDSIVPAIFGGSNLTPVQLQLDGASDEHDIFRALGQILTHGLEYLYGADVDVSTLSPQQIQYVQDCMGKIGYKVLINKEQSLLEGNANVLPYFLVLPPTNIRLAFERVMGR